MTGIDLTPDQIKQQLLDKELFDAITRNSVERVAKALEKGANPEAREMETPNRDYAIHRAAQLGNPSIALMLIRAGADIDVTNETDHTPVMLAALRGRGRTVKALLIHQADVKPRNNQGNTALHLAVTVDDPFSDDSINPLLCAGADVRQPNHAKKNVAEYAAIIGDKAAGALHQEIDALDDAVRPAFISDGKLEPKELFKYDGKGWELTPKNIGFWQQFDVILDRLAKQGDPVTQDVLTWKKGSIPLFDENLLEQAHGFYQLPKALAALAAHGVHLTPDDLFLEDGQARSFVQDLAEFGALDQLFVAENWEGVGSRQIRECYQAIKTKFPEEAETQVSNVHTLIANAAKEERAFARQR